VDAIAPQIRPASRILRRSLRAGLLALATAVLATTPAAASERTARSADSFVDSIGVNTHTFFNDTAYYSEFPTVKQKLAELGIRHIREDLVPDRPDQYERLNELAGIGVRSTLIMGDPDDGPEEVDTLLSIVRDDLRGAVEAVEGPNEFDSRGGADWLPRLVDYQSRLYSAVKSDPALTSLPVLAPSVVQRRNQEAMGDISDRLDYGNVHPYPDGYMPEQNLSDYLERGALNSGTKPVFATETGYHTTAGWTGEHNPVSEQAAAAYVPRLLLAYFRAGVARTYLYELLDQKPDRAERENNFGLLRNDMSEKPSFAALRNLVDILEDPGPSFEPGTVEYSLAGESEGVEDLLLQKRDGSFYLALWRTESVIDPESGTGLAPATRPVEIALERKVTNAAVYRPTVSSAPVANRGPESSGRLRVDVGAEVTLVQLTLGDRVQPGRIKAWVSRRSVRAGGRVAVKGRLPKQLAGRSMPVKVQQWRGHGWRTVGRGRTRKSGAFHKRIRIPRRSGSRASRVRVVARVAKPSRALRLRIRR
jgi:hypothetical protein